MMYLQLAGGLVLLAVTAEIMIRGAVVLAERLGMSPLMVGVTVVALGTSAPELVVALNAALSGAPGVAVGNVVGSNIANVLLIVGAAALIVPIARRPEARKRDGFLLVGFTALVVAVAWPGEIGFAVGLGLVIVFSVYMGLTIREDLRTLRTDGSVGGSEGDEADVPSMSLTRAIIATVLGLIGIAIGADLMVEGGVAIARTFGLSEEVIGLTLIAIGTSLPELAASIVAARQGHPDVALGNILGSNMFNMLAIAGITAMVTPLPVSASMLAFDMWVFLGATILIAPVLMGRLPVTRFAGLVLLLLYAAYLAAQGFGIPGQVAGFFQ